MKITIINKINGFEFSFLSQDEIYKEYGNEKVTLDTQDFINDKNLNLYSYGGDGGLFSIPTNVSSGYSLNFSQGYRYQGNKYNQRSIELGSSIPAILIINNKTIYDYLNAVLFENNSLLLMSISHNDRIVSCDVSCESSPLTNNSFSFNFLVWEDAVYSFLSSPKLVKFGNESTVLEKKYATSYPFVHNKSQNTQIIDVYNNSIISIPFNLYIKGGSCVKPVVTNLNNNDFMGYNDVIINGDNVVFNSEKKTLRKNQVNELDKLVGDFLVLEPGLNKLELSFDSFDALNPPIVVGQFREAYSNV